MADIHFLAIPKQLAEQTATSLRTTQPIPAPPALRPVIQFGYDAAGNPIGSFLGGLFYDVESAVGWVDQLGGEFCHSYNQGASVNGQQISIKEVLQKAADIASATGTADGKALSGSLTLVIAMLDAACK